MKIIKKIFFASILTVCLLPLTSCTFFYGPKAELSYEAMFETMWKDYNQTYALFEVRGVD